MKPYRESVRAFQIQYWTAVLMECDYNIPRASRMSGINRTHLYKKLQPLGVFEVGPQSHRGSWDVQIPTMAA